MKNLGDDGLQPVFTTLSLDEFLHGASAARFYSGSSIIDSSRTTTVTPPSLT